MRETRKQKIDRQRGHAADRVLDPIRQAMDAGELVITPDPLAQREYCPRHGYSTRCQCWTPPADLTRREPQ